MTGYFELLIQKKMKKKHTQIRKYIVFSQIRKTDAQSGLNWHAILLSIHYSIMYIVYLHMQSKFKLKTTRDGHSRQLVRNCWKLTHGVHSRQLVWTGGHPLWHYEWAHLLQTKLLRVKLQRTRLALDTKQRKYYNRNTVWTYLLV